jgi:NAD-dependent deacetylase
VRIITQNVDDLHERAGSTHVLHLHGEILYARSGRDPSHTQYLGDRDIALGDTCPLGSQLRPHIVWFGEQVPAMDEAARIVSQADIFLCIGTSLEVYPASSLIFATPRRARRIVVNPEVPRLVPADVCECIAKNACEGVPTLVESLLLVPTIL